MYSGYNSALDCFLCSHSSSFGCWELSFSSCISLTYPIFVGFCIFFFFFFSIPFFLVLEDTPGCSCGLPVPALESAISPRRPDSFYDRMVLENKICALGVCRRFLHFEITLQLIVLALWHLLTELWLSGVWGFVLFCGGASL